MKNLKSCIDYSIYLVTDRSLMTTQNLETAVEQAILGGCTLVQLREKHLSSQDFFTLAKMVKAVTNHYHIPLIINDRVDIALAVNAEGLHIGQSDLPACVARKLIGPDKILGVSASNLPEALAAQTDGADYLGIGAMFATGTKTDASYTSMEELAQIRHALPLPLVVIGGINKTTLPLFKNTGIDGIAVVSAILSQPDIQKATHCLKNLFLTGKEATL